MSDRLDAALAAITDAVPADAPEAQQLVATKCKALMVGYEHHWAGAEWTALALEQTVLLPVVNPETGRISRTWRQAGKFDGVVEGYGKTCLMEHKTTGDDVADPSSTYWRRLTIDSQVSRYTLQAWQAGYRLDGTLYDVIRKPGIRPKKLAAAERTRILVSHRYCEQPVPDDVLAELDAGRDSECHFLYGLRLVDDLLTEPQRYYQRRMIHRLDNELIEYAQELWSVGLEIQRTRKLGLHFRNPDACMQYGSPCEYLGICSGYDDADSDNWTRPETVHSELDGVDGDGRDVLTNSRVKCYQLCRRKHHLRYEVGIRRRNDEEREVLYFGSLLHRALEAWWGQIREVVHDDSDSSRAAIGVAQLA